MAGRRALHFVFKVADRKATWAFYRDVLGMRVLRHEEFKQGCEAACNGPYDNRWSKTMVGYGPEDTHFVVELTYNYNVHNYNKGNDFLGITIRSRETLARAKACNYPTSSENGLTVLQAPGGYKFYIIDEPQPSDRDPVEKVTLACSDTVRTVNYWKNVLGMQVKDEDSLGATLNYCDSPFKLEFKQLKESLDRAEAYGRIAFSVPYAELSEIESKVKASNYTVLTPLISLDTPGKATVSVVILADPDGHEICFVDDENFRKLSAVDPQATILLDRYIKKDDQRQNLSS